MRREGNLRDTLEERGEGILWGAAGFCFVFESSQALSSIAFDLLQLLKKPFVSGKGTEEFLQQ